MCRCLEVDPLSVKLEMFLQRMDEPPNGWGKKGWRVAVEALTVSNAVYYLGVRSCTSTYLF